MAKSKIKTSATKTKAKKTPRSIKVNFFRVEMPANAGTFIELLKSFSEMTVDDRNDIPDDTDIAPARIDHLDVSDTMAFGELIKLRMTNLPPIGSLDVTDEKPIDVTERQGLKEGAAFVYNVPSASEAFRYLIHREAEAIAKG